MNIFNREQATKKLDQFHQKLTEQIKLLQNKRNINPPKQYNYVVYQQKTVDSSTQTKIDKQSFNHMLMKSKEKSQSQLRNSKQSNLKQLKLILQQNLMNFAKGQKINQTTKNSDQLQQLKADNSQLLKQIEMKDVQIKRINNMLLSKQEQFDKQISGCKLLHKQQKNKISNQKKILQKQRQTFLKTIQNLELGISEHQKQCCKLSKQLGQKQNQMLVKDNKIKQLEIKSKSSDKLLNALSKEENQLAEKMRKMENQITIKTNYSLMLEETHLVMFKEKSSLQKELTYFSSLSDNLRGKVKDLEDQRQINSNILTLYQNLIGVINQELRRATQFNINIPSNPKQNQEILISFNQSIQRYIEYASTQQKNYLISFENQKKIFQEQVRFQKNLFENKLQQTIKLNSLSQKYLLNSIQQNQTRFNSLKQKQIHKKQISQPRSSQSDSQQFEDINQQNQNQIHRQKSILCLKNQSNKQPKLVDNKVQNKDLNKGESNGENKGENKDENKGENKGENKDQNLDEKKDDVNLYKENNMKLEIPQNSFRPPSFGKQKNYILDQNSDNQCSGIQTPDFTPKKSLGQNNHEIDSETKSTQHNRTKRSVKVFQADQNVHFLANQWKINQQKELIFISQLKKLGPQIYSSNLDLIEERKSEQKGQQSQSSINPSKQQSKQISMEENQVEKEKQDKNFTKKINQHVSNLSPNLHSNHLVSPGKTHHREHSDNLFIPDRHKKVVRKDYFRIQNVRLIEKNKSLNAEVEKLTQYIHNLHNIGANWRKIQRQKDKLHKFVSCLKLSQRLSQLVIKNNSIHVDHKDQTTNFTGELKQVMAELEKIIQQTNEWIGLFDKMNKREFQRHDKLMGRLKLKKTKTTVNKIKQKKSHQNSDQQDTIQIEKQKTVYSQGDSPRGMGQIDHFEQNPFDNIDTHEKPDDYHSLQKMFKQGPQISQISSVKNQSQISEFINSRSQFMVNMFDPKNFMKVEEQQIHPNAASAYHDTIQFGAHSHVNPNFHSAYHVKLKDHKQENHRLLQDKSIKSLRNICSKQKQKVKILEMKIIDTKQRYNKLIEKIVDQNKRKMNKIQKDFNKTLSMVIKLKVSNPQGTQFPQNKSQKQALTDNMTSIKYLSNNQNQSLSKSTQGSSKLKVHQVKSLTQMQNLNPKINERDEIIEQKIEQYLQKLQQLNKSNESFKEQMLVKTQHIEDLQKKLKQEKILGQRIKQRLNQQRKQINYLKTINKRIKNQFNQFMEVLLKQKLKEQRIQKIQQQKILKKKQELFELEKKNSLNKNNVESQVQECQLIQSIKKQMIKQNQQILKEPKQLNLIENQQGRNQKQEQIVQEYIKRQEKPLQQNKLQQQERENHEIQFQNNELIFNQNNSPKNQYQAPFECNIEGIANKIQQFSPFFQINQFPAKNLIIEQLNLQIEHLKQSITQKQQLISQKQNQLMVCIDQMSTDKKTIQKLKQQIYNLKVKGPIIQQLNKYKNKITENKKQQQQRQKDENILKEPSQKLESQDKSNKKVEQIDIVYQQGLECNGLDLKSSGDKKKSNHKQSFESKDKSLHKETVNSRQDHKSQQKNKTNRSNSTNKDQTQNFFDLETQTQFNNIIDHESYHHPITAHSSEIAIQMIKQKDIKIHRLETELERLKQVLKKIEDENQQKKRRKKLVYIDRR